MRRRRRGTELENWRVKRYDSWSLVLRINVHWIISARSSIRFIQSALHLWALCVQEKRRKRRRKYIHNNEGRKRVSSSFSLTHRTDRREKGEGRRETDGTATALGTLGPIKDVNLCQSPTYLVLLLLLLLLLLFLFLLSVVCAKCSSKKTFSLSQRRRRRFTLRRVCVC